MRIQFCGAARTVTGSAHLLTLDDGYTILLDCGLYQGHEAELKGFNRQWYFKPEALDAVVLSHAHIDHSGRLPKLVKDGFDNVIHSTHATRSLCSIMLLDSAHIQQYDAEYYNRKHKPKEPRQPLYTSRDVHQTMGRFAGFAYDKWFRLRPDVEVLFRDAGHILGSASVTLRIRQGNRHVTIGFTGDIGRPDRPILRDPQPMPEVDYLICESTYGDKDHEEKPREMERLLQVIRHTCVEKKGRLLIPAFSVGRTQEIVYMLDQLANAGRLPRIPVYVDSPLAVNATTIYGAHPECYDEELEEYLLTDDNPFGFNGLTYIRSVEASKALNYSEEPCIIISSAGMMQAGRVKHHLYHSIENPKNTILIVGYCTPDTPGGQLRRGARQIRLFGEWKQVRAEVVIMDSFSAHADRHEILDFISNQKGHARKIFLVHGEYDKQTALRELLYRHGHKQVEIPELGEEVKL